MPCPAERLTLPLFLDTSVHERRRSQALKHHDAGNETNLPVAPFSWQTGPLYLWEILQTAVPWPRGAKELRTECEFISSWQTRCEKSRAAVHVALTRLLNLLPACPKQAGFVYMPSKQGVTLKFHPNILKSGKEFSVWNSRNINPTAWLIIISTFLVFLTKP